METKQNNIKKEVLGIPAPRRAYDSQYHDKNCPFTGGLVVKKELFTGKVVKRDTNKSATIEWFRYFYVPKYERYEMRRSRLRVHNPPCLDAQVGQTVVVAKTRPLSKTKNHVILQILSGNNIRSSINVGSSIGGIDGVSSRGKVKSNSDKKSLDKHYLSTEGEENESN